MNRGEKRELLKLVEEQQQQLQRYEKRLGDLISAYKSLTTEKKALESSLKALSDAGTPATSSQEETKSETEPNAQTSEGGKAPQDQLLTLTQALATLTSEKSRMETNFQADKKKLLMEKEELETKNKKEKAEIERIKSSVANEVAELKKKVWSQQMEREKEHSDHAVMLRELQTLVAIERSSKEQMELQIEDLQRNLDKRPDFHTKVLEYETKINDLSENLQICKLKLKESESRADQPQPLLLKLQKELESLKYDQEQHISSLVQERMRANEAEEQLQHIARMSEERVANLELKLSELSETVGNYDRIRQQDQHAISSLKERVVQLDRENSLLSGAAGFSCEKVDRSGDDDSNLDIQTLLGRFLKIKSLLSAANMRSENPVDLKEILSSEGLSLEQNDHSACHEELRQLKDEFERYKLRAQSVLKNKNNKETSLSKEEETLKKHTNELKLQLKQSLAEWEEKERHLKSCLEETNATLSRTKQNYAEELSKCQVEFRAKIGDLENEMQKHRTRTQLLLEEKENEIKRLKISFTLPYDSSRESDDAVFEEADKEQELRDSVSRLVLGHNDGGKLLHYVQEMSRKDVEIATLRKARHELETALRELQTAMVSKEEKSCDEMEAVKAEVRRLQRNVSREGANLEYLKNVVLNYMLSSDAGSRQHMLNAIATMLKFSPKEMNSVQQYNKMWWWQQMPKHKDTFHHMQ